MNGKITGKCISREPETFTHLEFRAHVHERLETFHSECFECSSRTKIPHQHLTPILQQHKSKQKEAEKTIERLRPEDSQIVEKSLSLSD